MFVVSFEGTDS